MLPMDSIPSERFETTADPILLPEEVDHHAVRQAIDEWHHALPLEGNRAFFDLGFRLARAGMAEGQIRQTLEERTQFARKGSRRDRRSQIPYILRGVANVRRNRNIILPPWFEAPPLVPVGDLPESSGQSSLVLTPV
jgi:hypothetical protein